MKIDWREFVAAFWFITFAFCLLGLLAWRVAICHN
jgi:hypothetical protein